MGDLVDRAINRQRIFGGKFGMECRHAVITRKEPHPTTALCFFATAIGNLRLCCDDPLAEPVLQLRASVLLRVVDGCTPRRRR